MAIERFFIEDSMKRIELENFLRNELKDAGLSRMSISRTPIVTRIILEVAKPGLVIGKGGKNIQMITEDIAKRFKIDNPQIEIANISNPELDAKTMVSRMRIAIERGIPWKSVVFKTANDIINAGATGIELIVRGKLAGKGGRKMKHRIAKGYLKKAGYLTKLVDYAKDTAYTKAGAIGIKLRIIKPTVKFRDKIPIEELIKEKMEERKEEGKGEEKGEVQQEQKEEPKEKEEGEEEEKISKEVGKRKVKRDKKIGKK